MPPAPGAGLTRQEAEQHLYVVSMARCRNTVNCSLRLSLVRLHVNAELGPSLHHSALPYLRSFTGIEPEEQTAIVSPSPT
jgi:hypothetical protein